MNDAVKCYIGRLFPEGRVEFQDPCLTELFYETERLTTDGTNESNTEQKDPSNTNVQVLLTAQDYGQSIALPHFKRKRTNDDYFQSDLNISMFNIYNLLSNSNKIYLYDERIAEKDGHVVNSLRWRYLQEVFKNDPPPKFAVKVMDNFVGQNKSNLTMLFDAFTSLIFFERVANFYLIPGHSNMRSDNVTRFCKMALQRQNLFLPEQIAQQMNTVKNMEAEVVTTGFYDWSILKEYMTDLPGGFTSKYMFEFCNGKVSYNRLYTDFDDFSHIHAFTSNPYTIRGILLKEIFGLGPNASPKEIAMAPLKLPLLKEKKLTASREKLINMKLPDIPRKYRAYYSGHMAETAMLEEEKAAADVVKTEPSPTTSSQTQDYTQSCHAQTVTPGTSTGKKSVGRPKKKESDTSTQSHSIEKRPREPLDSDVTPAEQPSSSQTSSQTRPFLHVHSDGSTTVYIQ